MNRDIYLTNNLNNKKEIFFPLNKEKIGMYVCGPTVYDNPHIGNARPLVVFDILFKVLKSKYGNKAIRYIRNITDVDDKIIKSSKEKKISISILTKKIINDFNEDCDYLNLDEPSEQPKATDHISLMIEMILLLLKKNFAYEKDNHVYFEVGKFKDYGKLSNKKLEDLIAGSRVEISKNKKNVEDFVLWKPSNIDEPFWESPWGRGRPGWHLECSANYWIHNAFVTLSNEKMAKSQGNIIKIKDFKGKIDGQVLKLALLSAHYRQPLDWNEKLLNDCQNTIDKWYEVYLENKESAPIPDAILAPLYDDLNTPGYIANLHQLYDKAQKGKVEDRNTFVSACNFMGLLNKTKEEWLDFKKKNLLISDEDILKMIELRNKAREDKNYKEADVIRDELLDKGVLIEDKDGKTIWKLK